MKKNILIVEDEVLIATHIKLALREKGYGFVGIAISFEEAIRYIETEAIDLVLLDINISGKKSGIDIAKLLNEKYHIPFIYLTSYTDSETIEKLKPTMPRAYLNKPINEVMLITTLDIVFANLAKKETSLFKFKLGKTTYTINTQELMYLEADHGYIHIHLKSNSILIRNSMKDMIDILPLKMLQVNRSIIVNPKYITLMDKNNVHLQDEVFKISKTYRNQFLEY